MRISMRKTAQPYIRSEEPTGKIIVLSLFLAVLWGGNSLSIKMSLQDLPPLGLAFLRFALGLIAVGSWAFYRGISLKLRRGELRQLLVLASIFLMQVITLNVGTDLTTASRSTIFINAYPFFTALFAHLWIPSERLTVPKTLGITVAFIGVVATVAPNLQQGFTDAEGTALIGDLIVLISGGLLGLRVVVTKRIVQSIHPYRLLVWMLMLGLPCFLGLSLMLERGETFRWTTQGIAALFYQGWVIAGACYLAWTTILERYSASKLVVLFFATPLAGVLLSHLMMGDELTLSLLVGSALVAAGIYLVNIRWR
ncbi:hypothetical protein C6495_04540 [Candidatus Poribacteria bacterium]|nr:MAG: hypothetical protein C6495_04540 [Candidatus Poribacteria bacterium]